MACVTMARSSRLQVKEFQFSRVRHARRPSVRVSTPGVWARESGPHVRLYQELEDQEAEIVHAATEPAWQRRKELLIQPSNHSVGDRRQAYSNARLRLVSDDMSRERSEGAARGRQVLSTFVGALRGQVRNKNLAADWLSRIRNLERTDEIDEPQEEEAEVEVEDEEPELAEFGEEEMDEDGDKAYNGRPVVELVKICKELQTMVDEPNLLLEVQNCVAELSDTEASLEELKGSFVHQLETSEDLAMNIQQTVILAKERIRRFERHVESVRCKVSNVVRTKSGSKSPSKRRTSVERAHGRKDFHIHAVDKSAKYQAAVETTTKDADVQRKAAEVTEQQDNLSEHGSSFSSPRASIHDATPWLPAADLLSVPIDEDLDPMSEALTDALATLEEELLLRYSAEIVPLAERLGIEAPEFLLPRFAREPSAHGSSRAGSRPRTISGPVTQDICLHLTSLVDGAAENRVAASVELPLETSISANAQEEDAAGESKITTDGSNPADVQPQISLPAQSIKAEASGSTRVANVASGADSDELIRVASSDSLEKAGMSKLEGVVEYHTEENEDISQEDGPNNAAIRPLQEASSSICRGSHGISSGRGFGRIPSAREVLPGIIVYNKGYFGKLSPERTLELDTRGTPKAKDVTSPRATRPKWKRQVTMPGKALSNRSSPRQLQRRSVTVHDLEVVASSSIGLRVSPEQGPSPSSGHENAEAVLRSGSTSSKKSAEPTPNPTSGFSDAVVDSIGCEIGPSMRVSREVGLASMSKGAAAAVESSQVTNSVDSKSHPNLDVNGNPSFRAPVLFASLAEEHRFAADTKKTQKDLEPFHGRSPVEPFHGYTGAHFRATTGAFRSESSKMSKTQISWSKSESLPGLPKVSTPPPTPGGWPALGNQRSEKTRSRLLKTHAGEDLFLPPVPLTPPKTAAIETMNRSTLETVKLDRRRLTALQSHPSLAAQPRFSFPKKPWETNAKKPAQPFGGSALLKTGRKRAPVLGHGAPALHDSTSLPDLPQGRGHHHLHGWRKPLV